MDGIKEKINTVLSKYPVVDNVFTNLSEKIKVEKALVVIAAGILIPISIFSFLTGGSFVIDLIGFLYPFYASIKAIESSDAKDESIWLTYWLIFGLFKIFEEFGDVFLSYIPFYRVIKATFLIWAFYSKTQGANTVYTNLIKPYVVPALGILSTSDDDSKKEHKQ